MLENGLIIAFTILSNKVRILNSLKKNPMSKKKKKNISHSSFEKNIILVAVAVVYKIILCVLQLCVFHSSKINFRDWINTLNMAII